MQTEPQKSLNWLTIFTQCTACREPGLRSSGSICALCRNSLLPAPLLCIRCFSSGCLCIPQNNPQKTEVIQKVTAVFTWSGRSHEVFKRWKKTRGFLLEKELFDWNRWNTALGAVPDLSVIVPVPQSYSRSYRLKRSPAFTIAERLSQMTRLPLLPELKLNSSSLPNSSMAGQSLESRLRASNSMLWNTRVPHPNSVILVDDAITTGKTIRHAADALTRVGVKQIFVFALGYRARVSRSSDPVRSTFRDSTSSNWIA